VTITSNKKQVTKWSDSRTAINSLKRFN